MTKPILKRNSSDTHQQHSNVHFPPSPSLTRTFTTHCSSAYDRSPIVVSANQCAIPERNDRTYNIDDDSNQASTSTATHNHESKRGPNIAHDYHPRGIARALQLAESLANMSLGSTADDHQQDEELQRAQRRQTGSYAAFSSRPPPPPVSSLPPLVPDLSSESEESDGFASPCPPAVSFTSSRHPGKFAHLSLSPPHNPAVEFDPYNTPTPRAISILSSSNHLAFLPHPPSPPPSGCSYLSEAEGSAAVEKTRRRQLRRDSRDSRAPVNSAPYDDLDDGYARDRSSMSSGLSLSMNFTRNKSPSSSPIHHSPSTPSRPSPSSRMAGGGGTPSSAKGRERYRRYASASHSSSSSGDSSGCLEGF